MSIENFQGIYPTNRTELRDILSKQRDRERYSTAKSPVVLLALNLAREGGDGLRESAKKFNPSNMISGLSRQDAQRMQNEFREEISNNLGVITCGLVIYSIDDTIWNKAFSYELAAGFFNRSISGTPLPPLGVGDIKEEEEILDDKYKEMISLAVKDKTLTSFLDEENLHLMPNALSGLIAQLQIMPIIRNKIVPIFKPRAQLLID